MPPVIPTQPEFTIPSLVTKAEEIIQPVTVTPFLVMKAVSPIPPEAGTHLLGIRQGIPTQPVVIIHSLVSMQVILQMPLITPLLDTGQVIPQHQASGIPFLVMMPGFSIRQAPVISLLVTRQVIPILKPPITYSLEMQQDVQQPLVETILP